jgi:hypothetical protein
MMDNSIHPGCRKNKRVYELQQIQSKNKNISIIYYFYLYKNNVNP